MYKPTGETGGCFDGNIRLSWMSNLTEEESHIDYEEDIIHFIERRVDAAVVCSQQIQRGCQLRFKSEQVLRDLRFKTGHPPEVLGFEGLDVNKLLFMPKS